MTSCDAPIGRTQCYNIFCYFISLVLEKTLRFNNIHVYLQSMWHRWNAVDDLFLFFFVIVKSRGRTFILNSFPFYPVFFFCFLNVFIIFLIINVLGQRAVSRTHFIYFRVRHYRSLWLVRLFFFHSVR